jgi:hypothetical protein
MTVIYYCLCFCSGRSSAKQQHKNHFSRNGLARSAADAADEMPISFYHVRVIDLGRHWHALLPAPKHASHTLFAQHISHEPL